jgi:hypothetical protein
MQITFGKSVPRPITSKLSNPTPPDTPNNPMLKINPTFGKPKRLLYIHSGNVVKQTRFGYVLGILAA